MQNMKDFNDIQNLWKNQETKAVPDASAIINKAKKTKKEYNTKISIQITALVLALITLIWILFSITFQSITTYIGLITMILCIGVFSIARGKLIYLLKKIDFTSNPSHSLEQLEKVYQYQKWINTKLTKAYFLFISLAMGLYFIEVIHPFSLDIQLIITGLTLTWFLFTYFYLGKKQQEKENQRIESIIASIQQIEINFNQP